MNLSQLRFVRAVADAGTFTGGAARCYVTQSTLSTAIAHLEKELGERLFMRTTRSVSLTPFGHKLLPLIDDVLRAQDALVDAADSFLDPQSQLPQPNPGAEGAHPGPGRSSSGPGCLVR